MTDAPKNVPNQKRNSGDRGKVIAVIGGATFLIAASFGVQAIAESKTYQHAKLLFSETSVSNPFVHKAGWGGKKHGWGKGGRDHMRFSEMSDAEIEKKITRAVKHVSIEIDATDEQETKITALLTAVAKDMKPLHGQFRAAGKETHDLLLADSIDRAALEKLRVERLAEADRVCKELVTAIADVAEILSAEQRKVLDTRIQQFKSMRGRWHRG